MNTRRIQRENAASAGRVNGKLDPSYGRTRQPRLEVATVAITAIVGTLEGSTGAGSGFDIVAGFAVVAIVIVPPRYGRHPSLLIGAI